MLNQARSTQQHKKVYDEFEEKLRKRIIELASKYGRYGYRRITALLRREGWFVNHKRVQRIWREEGLKVPQKQSKRERLWLNDGSCFRRKPEYKNHVWSYDFMMGRTHNGRSFRILNIMDEYTRECLAMVVDRKIKSADVICILSDLFVTKGIPKYLRSDNGSEFTSKLIRKWLKNIEVQTLFIEPGSPWENGYIESFNGKFRDEFLDGEIFYSLKEAKILIERWRKDYNTLRPHSSLNYNTPVPKTIEVSDVA